MRRGGLLLWVMWAAMASATAQQIAAKPKLPPGRDPGGAMIGLLTSGLDPTRPDVARCLARDGEGEVIGWDMIDRTRAPFRILATGQPGDEGVFANLPCDGRVRVAPVRVDPADGVTYGKALAFFSTTLARVVVVPAANLPTDWTIFKQAAAAFPQVTVIVEVEGQPELFAGMAHIVTAPPAGAMADALRRAR